MALAMAALGGSACSTTSSVLPTSQGPEPPTTAASAMSGAEGRFLTCEDAPLPAGKATEGWDERSSRFAAWLGSPRHSANDVVIRADSSAVVTGKFTYTLLHLDVEEEPVELWVDDCSGAFRLLDRRETNSDGRVRFRVRGADLPSVGRYRAVMRVAADNSFTEAHVRVLPAGTRFVVFDIDETISAEGIFGTLEDAFQSEHDERVREAAVEVTRARRYDQGYQVLYLSARNYSLTELTRRWLRENGFAPGTVVHTQDLRHKWPSNERTGEFKRDRIEELQAAGFEVVFGYGNASTDWYAYRAAGLSEDRILMLGEGGEGTGIVNFREHLAEIRSLPAARQPFLY